MATIDKNYVDEAKLLLAQGNVSAAWAKLAEGGDPYGASARDLTGELSALNPTSPCTPSAHVGQLVPDC